MVSSPFIRQCVVTAAVSFNTIGYGSSLGFPPILRHNSRNQILRYSSLRILSLGLVTAVLALSLLAGNFMSPIIMNRLGRKITHYTVSMIFLVGFYIIILATNVEALIIGRLLQGIGRGILVTLRAVLIGEYTSPRNRGAFLSILSLAQAFGIMFVHLIGSFFTWQITALVCVFFSFVSLIMVMYTPESPSWLVTKGRYDECREVFRWLRGNEEDKELEDMILARIELEQTEIKKHKSSNFVRKWCATIKKKEFFKPILLIIHGNAIMHLSGGTTMASYSTVILGLLMGPNVNTYFWMVFLDIQRVISNMLAVYIINRTKRRIMVFSTGGLSALIHIAMAVFVYLKTKGWNYDSIWLPALLINIQFFLSAIGTVPLPQVIGGEVLPLEYRSIGSTIGSTIGLATERSIMFLVLKTFPKLIDSSGLHGTYALYTVIILINLLSMAVMLPETKGKTLQQIEDQFRGRPLRIEKIESRQALQSNSIKNYQKTGLKDDRVQQLTKNT